MDELSLYKIVVLLIFVMDLYCVHIIFVIDFEPIQHVFEIRNSAGAISMWSFIILQIYFYICLYLKLTDDKNKWLHKFKNTFFYSLIIPLNGLSCGGFWLLFLYDRNYIMPSIIDTVLPTWTNHVVHTMPPIVIIAQMLWSHDNVACKACYSVPSKTKSFIILNATLIAYIILLLTIYYVDGRWVYYGMQYLSSIQIVAVIATGYLSCLFAQQVGYSLHYTIAKHKHANMRSLQSKEK